MNKLRAMAIEIPIMQTAQAKYGSTDISGHYADMAKSFGGYGERIEDRSLELEAGSSSVYQVGKRRFARVSLT